MSWLTKEAPLTEEEMKNNANIIINRFRLMGYDDNTIASILGNMENESTINPGRYESGVGPGYGLIQWTPQNSLVEHTTNIGLSDWDNGDTQLNVVISELLGEPVENLSWYTSTGFIQNYYTSGATNDMIGITGKQYLHNEMGWDVNKLTILFMVGRERPSTNPEVNHIERRQADARKWLEYMGGAITPPTTAKRNFWWLYYMKKRF